MLDMSKTLQLRQSVTIDYNPLHELTHDLMYRHWESLMVSVHFLVIRIVTITLRTHCLAAKQQ